MQNSRSEGVTVPVGKGITGLHIKLQNIKCKQNRIKNLHANSLSLNSLNYSCYRVYL